MFGKNYMKNNNRKELDFLKSLDNLNKMNHLQEAL